MGKLLRDFRKFLDNDTFVVFDDFSHYVTADLWTTVATNSGSAAVSDGARGVLKINPSDGTEVDNDETYVKSTQEIFKFATDKPLLFAAKVQPYATTIASINLQVGLTNAVAADTILDNGGGPKASYHGAVFAKLDAGTKWVCETSISTSQTTVTTDHVVGNAAFDLLVITTKPISSTVTEVHFYTADMETDGSFSLLEVGLTTAGQQHVAQTITHTTTTELQIVLGCKAGAASDKEFLNVDWVFGAQKR